MADILDDIPTLRDVSLGDLHTLAVAMRISPKAAKAVLKERVEYISRRAGFPLGRRTGFCGGHHNTTIGVKQDTAGSVWIYVRNLHAIHLSRHLYAS